MVNNKRGHRKGKKKTPADTPEANADPSNTEALNSHEIDTVHLADTVQSTKPVQPSDTDQIDDTDQSTKSNQPDSDENDQMADTIQPTQATQLSDTDLTAGAVQSTKMTQPSDTDEAADTVKSTKNIQPSDTDQTSDVARATCMSSNEKDLTPLQIELNKAKQKLSDYEATIYQQEQSKEQSKKAQKKARSEDAVKIKELERHIQQQDEAFKRNEESKLTLEKQVDVQRSEIGNLKIRLKDGEGRLVETSLDLHKTTSNLATLNSHVSRLKKDMEKLQSHNATLMDDNQKLNVAGAETAEAANTLIDEQFSAQGDAARREETLQTQKEELEESKRQNKESGPCEIESDDGSDQKPLFHSRKRHQQRPSSNQERRLLTQGRLPLCKSPRALNQELEGMYSDCDLDSIDDFNLRLQSQIQGANATGGPEIPIESPKSLFPKPHSNHGDATASSSGLFGPRQNNQFFFPTLGSALPEWPKESGRQADGLRRQPKLTTQIKQLGSFSNGSTQTEAVNQTKQLASFSNVSTQTEAVTQNEEPASSSNASTQTDESIKERVHPLNQNDRSIQCEESKSPEQAALQTSSPVKVPLLQRIGFQYWFFIVAACLLLLCAVFAFYHGLQARAERDMWLAANDLSRRAVIYHRNASMQGQSVGWLTPTKMKNLGSGYGLKFRKRGVEM